jgi:hypothetical protein
MGGLTETLLLDAARYGFDEAGDSTANDVKTLAGFLSWAKPLRFLRDRLGPQGWVPGRHPDLETVISPDRTFQVACATGNPATGTDRMPSTHLDKGPLAGLAIAGNQQLSFPRSVHPQFGNSPVAGMETWYLLQYVDLDEEGRGEIRVELSLPKHFTGSRPGVSRPKRGYINAWKPRLKLSPIQIGDEAEYRQDELEEEIDVRVEPRGG